MIFEVQRIQIIRIASFDGEGFSARVGCTFIFYRRSFDIDLSSIEIRKALNEFA